MHGIMLCKTFQEYPDEGSTFRILSKNGILPSVRIGDRNVPKGIHNNILMISLV